MSRLTPQHLHSLEIESKINKALISERGYRTVEHQAELKRLGFSQRQLLVPTLVIPIWGVLSEIVGYQSRPDSPRMNGGKPVKYETPAGMKMVLDVPPSVRSLIGNPSIPLFITEGIKKGDALASCGVCVISLLGVWNWRGTNPVGGLTALPDWEHVAIKNRRVYVVFDSDVMLKPGVHNALSRLTAFLEHRGGSVALIYLPPGQAGSKQGVDDFLAGGATVKDLMQLATTELRQLAAEADDDEEEQGGSQATQLVRLGLRNDLFHDEKGDAFAAIEAEGHRETWPVRSTSFRRWLARLFYLETSKSPKGSAISDALTLIEAKAQYEGDVRRIWTRTAFDDDGIYIDLGDPSWQAVRLAEDGWTVMDVPPVHFVRGPASLALPLPERGGTLDELKSLINLRDDEDYYRVIAWLLGALRPRGPYPVLAFVAEQGSGKSVAARLLRTMVDPSAVPLRGMPRDERDLVIAARANHIICLDNVSHLQQWLSDALCRLATGGGWSTRRLYTDADEEIFTQSRPALITGIDDYISNGDLLDRAMLVNLPTISPQKRRQETELERDFMRLHPRILGALLDACCAALKNLGAVQLPSLPRMADFAAWVVAAENALGWPEGAFLKAYTAGATEAQDVVLEASIIGEPLREMVETFHVWEGTSTELLAALESRVTEGTRRGRQWPRTARGLASGVRRLAPTLRSFGIEVGFNRERSASRRRLINLKLLFGEETVQTVQATDEDNGRMDSPDRLDDLDDSSTVFPSSAPTTDQVPAPEEWQLEMEIRA